MTKYDTAVLLLKLILKANLS